MADHNDLGRLGEKLAIDYLEEQGYTIVDTNWFFQRAEVDIIAQKDKILAVVEVKTRSTLGFGNPQDFVSRKKIKLLVKVINEYLNQNQRDLDMEVRFDIVAIYRENKKYNIEHVENAFYCFDSIMIVVFCLFSCVCFILEL